MDGNTDPQMVPVMGGSMSGSRSVFRGEEVGGVGERRMGLLGKRERVGV